jgi:hypothetical protein
LADEQVLELASCSASWSGQSPGTVPEEDEKLLLMYYDVASIRAGEE